jgi:hypothetical protein
MQRDRSACSISATLNPAHTDTVQGLQAHIRKSHLQLRLALDPSRGIQVIGAALTQTGLCQVVKPPQ